MITSRMTGKGDVLFTSFIDKLPGSSLSFKGKGSVNQIQIRNSKEEIRNLSGGICNVQGGILYITVMAVFQTGMKKHRFGHLKFQLREFLP